MKAVIYARYSSDNQREESIDGQLRECMEYATYNEMQVVDNYIDRALTAKTDNRPNFQRMIKDSAKGIFDVIIVWKLDRFARNRYDSAHYKNILKKNGVKVVSATESISQDASGILLESMLEGYAEYYSAELAEKVKRGMTENALKGLWNGGQVPFGYVINKERKLDIDEVNAPIIKEIFNMCNDGMTIKAIYNNLKERNITRPNGKPLRYNAVRYILTNRTYIGEYNHSGIKIENSVPQLVSEELFNAVQLEIAKNSHAPARHTAKDDYLLTTKLFCGKCGAMMVSQAGTSHTNKVHRYYACVRQKKHKCDKKMIHKEKIENYVVYKTMQILQNDEYIDYLAELLYNLQYTESTMLPKLEEELKSKQKEIDNILAAVKKGLAQDTLLQELAELEKEKEEISISIAKENIKSPILTKDQYKLALSNYRKVDITKLNGKRKLIDTFINSIFVYDDNIKIVYNGYNKEEIISLDEIESSNLISSGAPNKNKTNLEAERFSHSKFVLFFNNYWFVVLLKQKQ